jgi:hypothetical protein
LSAANCPLGVRLPAHLGPDAPDPCSHGGGTWVAPWLCVNTTHQKVLQKEVLLATELMERCNLDGAFRHLERVHVLGQTDVRWHVLAHWLMLKIAIRRGQSMTAIGQAFRIVLGAIGSAVGRVPTGNTGGSDVSMFARMPIAPELLRVMEGTTLERRAPRYPVWRTKSWNT